MRVEILHSAAKSYFSATYKSDLRFRVIKNGELFPFNADLYDLMEKESYLVGMIMAWSVITLESLVNHALVEIINDKSSAIQAIEYPRKVIKKLSRPELVKSDLARKIAILSDNFEQNDEAILQFANELSEIRNTIVHDKPFELIDLGDGEIEITHFRVRGNESGKPFRYENLSDFYIKCEKINNYISSIYSLQVMGMGEISFINLIND
ncbi:hypothetical protein [Pectobacterium brasiliense]|uniref:hypothetical protein n=1 Tax=Pectobacterium brasiliense TaxID=180957 RepID=UPI00058260F1|nr:hypothetical protein [Pectobacterium brasiliense]KHT24564.1 hypothetical protein RC95_03300 [Pectobacterium brasiliense]